MTGQLFIDPPRAAGPIALGMPADAAMAALRTVEGYLKREAGIPPNPAFAHYSSGLSISICPGAGGLVDAVEIYRPSRDVTVLFGDIPVFDLPADEVIRRLKAVTTIDIQDEGLTVVAPALLLAFGRSIAPEDPADPDGRYFESVLVAAPGYYNGPAEVPVAGASTSAASASGVGDEGQTSLF